MITLLPNVQVGFFCFRLAFLWGAFRPVGGNGGNQPAANVNCLTGDIRRRIGGQEGSHVRHLLRLGYPSQRDVLQQGFQVFGMLLPVFPGQFGLGVTGGYAVNADIILSLLQGQGLGEIHDACPGCGMVCRSREGAETHPRADIDNIT